MDTVPAGRVQVAFGNRKGEYMSDSIVASNTLDAATIEQVLVGGDLSKLTPEQRLAYYKSVTTSIGLNPLTKPFEYIVLNGKMVLYARRDCTDQLRTLRNISITIASRETIGEVYVVTARASTPEGRTDESTGAVSMKGLAGEALANAMMKAETKAKRRVTLSIAGLGMLDETEADSIPDAKRVEVNTETGEVVMPAHIDVDSLKTEGILPDADTKTLISTMYEAGKHAGKTTGGVREIYHDLFGVEKYTDLSDEQLRKMIVLLGGA
jgi:hypothetical protein